MTMFEFMQNAFFLLCGIICIAAAVLVIYCVIVAIFRTCGKRGTKKYRIQLQRRYAKEKRE